MKRRLFINFSASKSFDEVNYSLKNAVRDAIEVSLEHQGFRYDAELSVTFCDDAYIRRLNKKYRNIDKSTDVLSFPMYEDGNFELCECISGAMLGDIVISVEHAAMQAQEIGNSFLREVAFLTVHSTLHLLGYDHERSPEDEEKQCAAQREIMALLTE